MSKTKELIYLLIFGFVIAVTFFYLGHAWPPPQADHTTAERIRRDVQAQATNKTNTQERLEQLFTWGQAFLKAGRKDDLDRILPPERFHALRRRIESGEVTWAAQEMDRVLLELVDLLVSPTQRIALDCFFAVHCEPQTAAEHGFDTLRKIMHMAEFYRVKVTFEFTAQWAEMISADKKKLGTLRQWEKDGHEIGAHHHPYNIHSIWDGYTDIPSNRLQATRTDWLGKVHRTESYRGTIQDYITLLRKLPASGNVVTGCLGRLDQPWEKMDWHSDLLYNTEGYIEPPAVPRRVKIRGQCVWVLPLFALDVIEPENKLVRLCELYNKAVSGAVTGVVIHASDIEHHPRVIENWFKFLKSKDPEGKLNKTVSQIMEERLVPYGSEQNMISFDQNSR